MHIERLTLDDARRAGGPAGIAAHLRSLYASPASVQDAVREIVERVRAAGVLDVAVCAPPGPDGEIDAAILGTCRLCGVERVYRMGGAQAVAALAYGTDSVRPVDVVVGPGNLYVQEAKRLLSATVGIDGFAGPSDLLVLLGADAGEREVRLAALDMLAQAEHGAGSLVAAGSPAPEVCNSLAATPAALV